MTTQRRTAAISRGAAALVVLGLLLLGLPLLLVHEVGWPLPTSALSLDQIGQAITTGGIEDGTIIKALAVLVWLAWLNFTSAVALEGAALLRGRLARRRAVTHTAQHFAGQLLTSISLAFSLLARPAVAADGPDPAQLRLAVATALAEEPAPVAGHVPMPADDPPTPRAAASQPVKDGRDGDGRSYLVHRGDTLWDVAERFLGDGLRWREVRDANVGRAQPGGVSVRADSEDIEAGWTLLIPHLAGDERPPPTGDAAAERVTVAPGDTLWDIAGDHLGDPYRWPDVYEENRKRPQVDGRALTDPDLIQPGWVLELPLEQPDTSAGAPAPRADPAPDGDSQPEPEESGAPPVEGPAVETPSAEVERPGRIPAVDPVPTPSGDIAGSEDELPSTRAGETSDDEQQSTYVFATAAAALAGGVVLTLDRIRRARRRRREPGSRIPLPDDEAALAEQRLRATADEDTQRFVDLALRDLARSCADTRVPPVVLVSYDADALHVHLVGAHEAPDGWSESEDSTVWSRPRPANLAELEPASGTPSRLPALVTLGALDGGEVVLLNLAQSGCLHLDGDPEQVAALLSAWALELATTGRADALDVVTHGIDALPADLERFDAVEDPDELRSRLAGPPPTDSALPTTVVLAAGLEGDLASWIRVATEQRSDRVAAVAAPPPRAGAWSVHLTDGHGHLVPEDVAFAPLTLEGTGLAAAADLLDQAKHEEDRPVPIPPLPEERLIVLDDDPEPTKPQITVRVLGKVEVEGVGPFPANKTMELIVYLAMGRDGADADTILEALWPGQTPKPARLYTEAWRARKVLGTAPDGTPYLPDAELGIYRLSEGVALDYEEFQSRVAKARQQPDDAATHLRAALDLVRGRPLSKTATEYAWAIHDSHRMAQEVADAAHGLARLLLGSGRYDEAATAAEDGLKAEPASEALTRDLMEIAAASGNGGRVHDLMTRLRREIAEDGDANDADDYLHPDTLATFERLTRGTAQLFGTRSGDSARSE